MLSVFSYITEGTNKKVSCQNLPVCICVFVFVLLFECVVVTDLVIVAILNTAIDLPADLI